MRTKVFAMKNNLQKRLIASGLAVVLLVLCSIFVFFPKEKEEPLPVAPDVVIGVGGISGSFLPFFEASEGDADVRETVLTRLAYNESDTSVSASDSVPSIAESLEIFYADRNLNETEEYSGAYTAARYILKNGISFSDGTSVTSVDAVFSLYALLDPKSKGDKSAFDNLWGYDDYVEGIKGVTELAEKAVNIFKNDTGSLPSAGDGYTAPEASYARAALEQSGEEFARRIKSTVLTRYVDDKLLASNVFDGITSSDVLNNEALANAYSMRVWNYGTFLYDYVADEKGSYVGVADEDGNIIAKTTYDSALKDESYVEYVQSDSGKYALNLMTGAYYKLEAGEDAAVKYERALSQKYVRASRSALVGFRDTEGVTYTLQGDDYPTMARFFDVMRTSYTSGGVFDYEAMEANEGVDLYSFSTSAALAFAKNYSDGVNVTSIPGIRTGLIDYNGEEHECITLYFEGNDYNSAYYSNFFVVSKNSCLAGYDTSGEIMSDAGTPVASDKFFDHLKSISSAPVSAGPYKVESFEDGTVKLAANENFATLGVGISNARINEIYIRDVSDEDAVELLNSGEINILASTVTKKDIEAISSDVTAKYYPNSTYKYIMINPAYCRNLSARRAIVSTLNPALMFSDTARPISRSVPTYFDSYAGALDLQYDETGETAATLFKAAGYFQNDYGQLIDPSTREYASFKFYMLPNERGGDSEKMLLNSANILRSIGAEAEIIYDSNLMDRVFSDGNAAIYVLGWDVSHDLSLYERYAVSSKADAVKACGLVKLVTVGQSDAAGTLTYTSSEGNTVTTNQSQAVTELDKLITRGMESTDRSVRRENFVHAQEILTELCFEIPLCEYENVILVRRDIIAQGSICKDASGAKNPFSDIWHLRYAKIYSETET